MNIIGRDSNSVLFFSVISSRHGLTDDQMGWIAL